MIGQNVGHYRILEKLGEGGMGVVYRAEDTTLDRRVALKVLPPEFTADPERLARFEREAKLLASLNNPNIAAVYGLEKVNVGAGLDPALDPARTSLLVMELVEGENLAERLERGAVPMDEALPMALQIAAGLEAAHESGVVHRDLKPSNVMVDPDGRVKLLDFGLAKAMEVESSPTPLSMSPTLTADMTQPGVILGTAAYMSPEQARGKPVDQRADLWAFGVLLFEMLSGRRLFTGETVTDVLAAVVKSEPDWATLPADTPGPIRRLLARCLTKDRDLRLHHAGDARLEILEAQTGETDTPKPPETSPIWTKFLPWVVAGLAVAVAIWTLMRTDAMPQQEEMLRLTVELPIDTRPIHPRNSPAVVLSPTGNEVITVVAGRDSIPLYRRTLDDPTPQPIPGTEGATLPFFSPDGLWLGYFHDGEIFKIHLPRGAPIPVVKARDVAADPLTERGASWSRDHSIIYTASQESPLYLVAAEGGESQQVTTLEENERSHRWPSFLPDGKTVLFTVEAADDLSFDEARIEALDLATGTRTKILEGGTSARYSSTGHLLYVREGDLYATRFDSQALSTTGAPVVIYEDMLYHAPSGSASYDVSSSGSFVVIPEFRHVALDLVMHEPNGSTRLIWSPDQQLESARASPDGKHVAVQIEREIWLYDVARKIPTRLTTDMNVWGALTWSADGERLAFAAQPRGRSLANLHWTWAFSAAAPEMVFQEDVSQAPGSWSADGIISYHLDGDLYLVNPDDIETNERITNTPFTEKEPVASPDGQWLAYTSDESGRDEIYIQKLHTSSRKHRVSIEGGLEPTWSHQGDTLYYRTGNVLMSVKVALGSSIEIGSPKRIAAGALPRFLPSQFSRLYDVLPEPGSLLLLGVQGEAPAPNPIWTFNWASELERLVP